MVAPEDMAVYGGLCALATFSREEMKRRVLDNSSFKNFLDLVPQVRRVGYIGGACGRTGDSAVRVTRDWCKMLRSCGISEAIVLRTIAAATDKNRSRNIDVSVECS